jgi:uncharacterized membrane protein YeaQ/YmgE (transglycosylase-associated protein family)
MHQRERTVAPMGFIGVIFVGLIVGVVAKLIMPGRDPGGFIVTVLLGMGGAIVANLLGHAMGFYGPDEAPGFIAAVFGAGLLLWAYRMMRTSAQS